MKSLLFIVAACFAAGGILMLIACRKVDAAERQVRWIKYVVYFAIVTTMLVAAKLGSIYLKVLLILIISLGGIELLRAIRVAPEMKTIPAIGLLVTYGLIAVGDWFGVNTLEAETVAWLYLVVAGFDGFSQVFGQLLGRHKIAPRISPGKTLEGALGGVFGALCMALLVRPIAGLTILVALKTGLLLCLVGLVGDLAASWLKRRASIKDFGRLLPGHGGVLDRFDSFLPALAIGALWL